MTLKLNRLGSLTIAALWLTIVTVCAVAEEDVAFPQAISSRFLFAHNATSGGAWPVLPFDNVVQVVPLGTCCKEWTVALTGEGQLWLLDAFAEDLSPTLVSAVVGVNSTELSSAVLARPAEGLSSGSGGDILAFANQNGYWTCRAAAVLQNAPNACKSYQFAFGAPISSIQQTNVAEELYIGTLGRGLFHATAQAPAPTYVSTVTSTHVTSLAYLVGKEDSRLAVGTRVKVFVWHSLMGWTWEWVAVPTGLVDGIVDAVPTAMTYLGSDNSLWIGNIRCINVQHSDLTYRQLAAAQGLPFGNVTAAGASGAQIWLGTSDGVVRYDAIAEAGAPRQPWSLYRGNRWLPSGQVRSLTGVTCKNCSCTSMALFVTDTGLATIKIVPMTLAEKAAQWQSLVWVVTVCLSGRH